MDPSDRQLSDHLSVPATESTLSAESEIRTPSTEVAGAYCIRSMEASELQKMSGDILALQQLKLRQLRCQVMASLDQMKTVLDRNIRDVWRDIPIAVSICESAARSFDSAESSRSFRSSRQERRRYDRRAEDSVPTPLAQLENWKELMFADTVRSMEHQLQATREELRRIIEERAYQMDKRISTFQYAVQQSSQVPTLVPLEAAEPEAIPGHDGGTSPGPTTAADAIEPQSGIPESVADIEESVDRNSASTRAGNVAERRILCVPVASISPVCPEPVPSADDVSAKNTSPGPTTAADPIEPQSGIPESVADIEQSVNRNSASTRAGNVAKRRILCVPVASISPVCPEPAPSADEVSAKNRSPKLKQIFHILRRKRKEQSPSTVPSGKQARRQRTAARAEIKRLWSGIDTHPVILVGVDKLGVYVQSLVMLSLAFEDKKLFYDHALYCALQLRDPSNVEALAIATTSTDAVAAPPVVNWSAYESSICQFLVPLSTEEKRFVKEVAQMRPTERAIWGSAFACLVLRLGDRSAHYVRRKLESLNEELANAYELDENCLPRPPLTGPAFNEQLRRYQDYRVEPVGRSTLFRGLIERYECDTQPQRTRNWLNFLLLKSVRYGGLSLVTLVDECRKVWRVGLEELVAGTMAEETAGSWQTYKRFSTTFRSSNPSRPASSGSGSSGSGSSSGGGCSWKYKYCEVFRPQMYRELHFEANYELCTLLCVLVDVGKRRNRGHRFVAYHKLMRVARAEGSLPPIEASWKRKCVEIVKQFAAR